MAFPDTAGGAGLLGIDTELTTVDLFADDEVTAVLRGEVTVTGLASEDAGPDDEACDLEETEECVGVEEEEWLGVEEEEEEAEVTGVLVGEPVLACIMDIKLDKWPGDFMPLPSLLLSLLLRLLLLLLVEVEAAAMLVT